MDQAVVFLEPKGTVLEVIREAKARGYRVAAICSDPTLLAGACAPYDTALSLIDEIHAVDGWSDESSVESLCARIHQAAPIAGFYAGVDSCAAVLARLRRSYGLPAPAPGDVALVLDKFRLRRKLVALGLSRLRNFHSSELGAIREWPFPGAAYFKPVHGFASAYVRKCANLDDLARAREAWSAGAAMDPPFLRSYLRRVPEYHVEEAIEGELLSVEGIATGGRFRVLGLLSRILYSGDPVVEMGSCFPYPHPRADAIIERVERAHAALGLVEGPTHTEVIVSPSGEIEIIDLNPRFVGADVLQSINEALGIRVQEALLDYAVGKGVEIRPTLREYSCLQYFFPPVVPVLKSVAFPMSPEVRFRTTFLKPGEPISNTNRQIDYLGCYLTVMPEFESAIARSRELRQSVIVNAKHGGVY